MIALLIKNNKQGGLTKSEKKEYDGLVKMFKVEQKEYKSIND